MFLSAGSLQINSVQLRILFLQTFLSLLFIGFAQWANGQVIQNDTKITINWNGKKITEKTILVQINNKQENWLSHVEINHDPKQNFSFKYAKLIDLDGKVFKKLKKKDLITRSDLSYQAFFQDDLVTEFDLYSNRYPYWLEYSYEIIEKEFISVCWWSPYIYKEVQVLNSSLKVTIPQSYKVHISQRGEFKYQELNAADENVYTWYYNNTQKVKDEIFSPPFSEYLPQVVIVPSQFNYGEKGSFDSWQQFGMWMANLNEGTDQLTESERYEIKELVKEVEDKREIIRILYKSLQNQTRYVNVAIDVGGLKSYSASYVKQNKYGDCKALTTYIKAMLKSVGIDSYYTLINAGENASKINAAFPSQQFNHVILTIPLNGDTIWLENTSNIAPINYLGVFTQNRKALMVNGPNSKLITTPALELEDVLTKRVYTFYLSNKQRWETEIRLHIKGELFEEFLYKIVNEDESDQLKVIRDNIGIEKYDLKEWNYTHQDDSTFITIKSQGDVANPMRNFGRLKVINPLKIKIPEFEKPGLRKYSVRINYPINKLDSTVYLLKDTLDIQFPANADVKSSFGKYSTSFNVVGSQVVVAEQFQLYRNEIPLKGYEEFYSFIQSILNYKRKSSIIFK